MPKKKNASSLISELKRKTRRNDSSEEKIRIVIEGMRGEMTIVELCLYSVSKKPNFIKFKLFVLLCNYYYITI